MQYPSINHKPIPLPSLQDMIDAVYLSFTFDEERIRKREAKQERMRVQKALDDWTSSNWGRRR